MFVTGCDRPGKGRCRGVRAERGSTRGAELEPSGDYHFDGWTLRSRSGELLRAGRCIRLQAQPQQILEELLARSGELVTRERLIERLWPEGIVDFDTALNSSIRRLRGALGDHADYPRYIETIPKRGYRFIGRLDAPSQLSVAAPPAGSTKPPSTRRRRTWLGAILALGMAIPATVFLMPMLDHPQPGAGGLRIDGIKEAQEAFTRAQHFLHRRKANDLELARQYFSEALVIDPQFARALAGLASAYWIDTMRGSIPREQGLPMVRDAAERALAIDPGLAEAHLRLANYWGARDEPAISDEHFARAQALAPEDPLVVSFAAGAAATAGRFDEAVELQRRSVAADPLDLASRWNLATWLYAAGRIREAREELVRWRELEPDSPQGAVRLARMLILEGRHAEALDLATGIPDEPERLTIQAMGFYGSGDATRADAALEALIALDPGQTRFRVAEVLAYRGDRDRALEWLAQAGSEDTVNDHWSWSSPFLAPLRSDARWRVARETRQ
jgi:DNA-binding winged helix-turn-helix (wHTH) protein/tetratricopeptide (TPR) repeat protein